MAGTMSRDKGARGEREAREILLEALTPIYVEAGVEPPNIQRNLMQSRTGGFDLVGIPWLALEVKRQETLQVPAWWRQTLRQAQPGQVPFLMYRQNRTPWRCRTILATAHGPTGRHAVAADLDLANALEWLQHEARWRLAKRSQ